VRAVNFDKIFFVPGVWREFTNILERDVGLTGVDDPEMRAWSPIVRRSWW